MTATDPSSQPNGQDAAHPAFPGGVARRFEEMVRRDPGKMAVGYRGESITYGSLNAAANRLAHRLVGHLGWEPAPVGLVFEPGFHLITALLAVLKAGKFYVPLDPDHPPARFNAIYQHARPPITLTVQRHAALVAAVTDAPDAWLCLDNLALDGSSENLDLPLGPDALLNITYTSGSTGKPKGVLQTQGNIWHNILSSARTFSFAAEDRFSQLMSVSFGASVSDILGALLTGATLLPYDLHRQGIAGLARWLIEEEITVYHSVPTVFRRLLDTVEASTRFPAMRLVKLGGEPVFARDVARFRQHFAPGCILRNGLASTETYVATWFNVDHGTRVGEGVIPVGHPMPGTTIYLWDDEGVPVPAGEEGEIVVHSPYLSPGYWRDPEASAERFIETDDGRGRLYRTGDLGRLLPDGMLAHLGRLDDQVKIQGNRVEVAEVEIALLDLAEIREASVVVHQPVPGDNVLVAYVVPAAGFAPTEAEIRAHLARRLPVYMLPGRVMMLESLPLLPFGKVNKRALPPPRWDEPAAAYAPPTTPLEEDLCRIWAEVLGVARVGLHDDFVALGGDSLGAAEIASRLREEMNLDLPLSILFQTATVDQMAREVVRLQLESLDLSQVDELLSSVEGLSDEEIEALLTGPATDGR